MKSDFPESPETRKFVDRLRQVGLRATGPRLAILSALQTDRRHPSAEMLHTSLLEQYPSLSLSTVYATLETFLHKGLIHRIAGPTGKLRVDGTSPDHDHAICRSCGGVFDVHSDTIQRPPFPEELPEGLRVKRLHIEYEVICPECGDEDHEPERKVALG